MKTFFALAVVAAATHSAQAGPNWESIRLSSEFYAEGAAHGDIDGDGHTDIAYGPLWFTGPDFRTSHRFTTGDPFVAERGYSDNFFSYLVDADSDGDNDILVYGFPGKEARLYLNPGGTEPGENWRMVIVADEVSNESPAFVDLVPGGLPEIVATKDNTYGYYEAGANPTEKWTWQAISEKGDAGGRFEHGLGVGDLNNDGRPDIVQRMFWYEQPEKPGGLWRKHRWALVNLPGGAQILVHDFDGDGDSDLVTSIRAHGYGLSWFEQFEPGKFERHDILGERSVDNPFGVCFSQLHALALADIDGDGRMDFVTGKRYLAHQGKDPGGLQEPVLYWFQNTLSEDGGEVIFVPRLVDRDSGVGVEVKVADLDGDGAPDIISGNKKGLAIHLRKPGEPFPAVHPWKDTGRRPQEDYHSAQSPGDARDHTDVPDGFTVDLIAAEPDLVQPIAMCFDARGRIWVIEGHTYPQRAPDGQGRDRILIFEDGDGDGSFENRKVFAENLNLASGIEVGFDGVYVGAAPYLLFFPDKDKNDEPDGEPERLLDGWGYQDTHETLNSFTWGPDGWLYGCQGVFTHSKVGKPGTPDGERIPMNCGVWRFHPVRKEFEVFAHGTSNPWGVDFNEVGDWFISACVIPHFYHITQGGRYQRQAGQHFNPWTFDDLKTIADHAHYAGNIRDHAFWGANRTSRPPAPTDTSALGGGHAHCGLALYLADTFPEEYRGDAFFHNLHGHRMVRERLERNGSGYVARHRPDFVLANDHHFIGVGVMLGPDGALYYSDWTDPQTCHHRDVEIWDRSNGRLFRVRHGEARTTRLNLPELDDLALTEKLADPNAFIARQAQRLLQERASTGRLDADGVRKALLAPGNDRKRALRHLWAAHVAGLLSEENLVARLDDADPYVRGWALQFLGEGKAPLSPGALARVEKLAAEEFSLVTRRYLASLLQRLPHDQRAGIARGLITHGRSSHDPNLPLLCWYGIEPLMETDPAAVLSLAQVTKWPQLKDFITRRGVATPEGREKILQLLSRAANPAAFSKYAGEMLRALESMPPVDPPEGWKEARIKGEQLARKDRKLLATVERLGVRFGDPDSFPRWRSILRDAKRSAPDRLEAMKLLTAGGDPELGKLALEMLAVPAVRAAAVTALRDHPGKETAQALVDHLERFPLRLRNEAINLLASRPDMALVLLRAVDGRQLSTSLVSPVLLDQFARFKDGEIDRLIAANWVRGSVGTDPEQLRKSIEEWKRKLSPAVLATANASRGRETYRITCGNCHQLFGEGIAIGPDLTGSNRTDLGYVLENVLAPNAVVGKDYLLHVFTLKNGSTVSGMIREETPEHIGVAMPGGTSVDVKVSEIRERQQLTQSLMPAGLFEALPPDQVADLVKYLASPRQVPLPGETPPGEVPPPAKGVVRIEGESLVGKAKHDGGRLTAQPMSGFGKGWSGNRHLWWTGGKPGNVLSLRLTDLEPGTRALTLFPTTARDYATIQVTVMGELKEADLYTEAVLPGEPIRFEKITIPPDGPVQIDIHITGKNPKAVPAFMVGIDRIEIRDAGK